MKRKDSSPEAYRNDVAGQQRELLETIRELIFEVAPEADEVIQHGMLGYPGLANLAAQKHHVALYVMPSVLERHRGAFPGVSCGKSCLRFSRPEQVSAEAVRALLSDVRRKRGS